MPQRLKCKGCGVEWTYAGYPSYIGCPNCGSKEHEFLEHEEVCPYCSGTGKRMTCEVKEDRYNGVDNDRDASRVAKEILDEEKKVK